MSSAQDGVNFDFYGNGTPIKVAWPKKGSKNGWLALPQNGAVTNARELFGNLTPQFVENDRPPNGFAALAVYDDPAKGGNNNGKIDLHDAIWSQLRVWIDENRDGVSQPKELYTLDSIGIQSIDLRYLPSEYVDAHGNAFRYKGKLDAVNDNDGLDRKIFDVFLATR